MKNIIILILSLIISGELCASSDPDSTVVYKKIDGIELKLHFFFPLNHDTSHKTPTVVFFHGGGWKGGAPSHFYNQSAYFATRGMVAINVQYRTENVNKTTPVECVKDGKSAMRWIRKNAAKLGVDPDQLIAGGGSAGGHIAAATATLDGFNEEGEDSTINCRPNALILFNPVANNSSEGYGYDRVKDYWKDFSPYHNLHKNTPPTLIMLGTKDKLFKPALAEQYKQKMESFGLRCDLILYEDQNHAFFNKDINEEMHYQTMMDADVFLTSLGYLKENQRISEYISQKKQISEKEIADLAIKMEGGDNSDELPWRLNLGKPLDMPEGGKWFQNAGFGLFIHWGPASAHYGSPWVMRRPIEKGSDMSMASYKDYYETSPKNFTAENYNPEEWIKAAGKAGFRYVVLTSKHHDGYSLWPSKYTNFGVQSYLDGKDLLQPYVDAIRKNDLKVGFYFSGVDWHLDKEYMSFMNTSKGVLNWKGEVVKANSIQTLPKNILKQKKKMVFEVMSQYKPDLWWWDSGLPVTTKETAKKYNPNMLFNNRGNVYHPDYERGPYPGAHFVTPENFDMVKWEYMKKLKERGIKWEVCMSINKGYGWFYENRTSKSENIRDLGAVLFAAARVRCWGGNILLNIKPRPDGTLPQANYEMFEKMERWMAHSSKSVYDIKGTHFPEQSNVPITTSMEGDIWYIHARPGESKWQKGPFYEFCDPGKPIKVQNVPEIASVKLLRTGEKIEFTYINQELVIANPDVNPDGLHEVIELTFK